MSEQPLVEILGLEKRYGAVHAVRGLDFTLHRGQVMGLLGANGAGKSTTMAMMAGVLAPSAGSIRISGHDLAQDPIAAKARLGYLPETPPLFAELTVDEYLYHCAVIRGIDKAALETAINQAKARCGLADTGARLLDNLSKGYRQRVGIAQAIVHEPDLVILDEPTSGLDPAQLRDIRSLIRSIGEQHAVVFSTHLLPEVQQVCDSVQIIHHGQLAHSAPIDALDDSQDKYRVRFTNDVPAALDTKLMNSLPMVSDAEQLDEHCFAVHIAGGDELLAEFSRTCAQRGWVVLELAPMRTSLEDLFMATAYSHDPQAARLT